MTKFRPIRPNKVNEYIEKGIKLLSLAKNEKTGNFDLKTRFLETKI